MSENGSISSKARPATAPPRVLIVEDEAALSMLLTYNLESEGYSVEHADRVARIPPR